MSEKDSLDKSDLLSGYLDEDLSPRQINELKRMLAHDPQMEQEFAALQRQRQLLRSLPVESAPEHLASDIKAALERRFILDHNFRHHESAGKWGLTIRRLAATAAMVLLPLALLGIVVYTIVRQPSSDGASAPAPIAQLPPSDESSQPGISAKTTIENPVLFSAVLQFHTRQPVLARDYVEKNIHTLGLMDKTQIRPLSDRTSYKITCSRQYIAGLVSQMQELWPHCENATYALLDVVGQEPVQVENATPQQVVDMVGLSDLKQAPVLAKTFTEQNTLAAANPKPEVSPLEQPIQPTLAWDKNAASAQDETQDTICLVIEVLGL